jgi:hypothetical protein
MPAVAPFGAAEVAMWRLVEQYTGKVGYERPIKAEGLARIPPVIDCSGWVAFMLTTAMEAENAAAGNTMFASDDIAAMHAWSDRIISEIERRSKLLIVASDIAAANLPRCSTIGLKWGKPAWANNHPRSRDITHIAQLVRRPTDDEAFVSESINIGLSPGVRLTPLQEWLDEWKPSIRAGDAWAVNPFAMGRSPVG